MSLMQTGPYEVSGSPLGVRIEGVPERLRVSAALDLDGATEQVSTVTIAGAENSETYSLTITETTPNRGGKVYTLTAETDADATITELRDALWSDALGQTGDLFSLLSIVRGTGTLVLTANAGRTFTVTIGDNPGNHLSVATVAGGAFVQRLYGRAYELGEVTTNAAGLRKRAIRSPQLPARATLVFDVDTNANTQTVTATVAYTPFGGATVIRTVTAASGASAAATAEAIETAVAAAFPEAVVVEASPLVTATFPAGDSVAVVSSASSGGLDVLVSTTAAGALPRLGLCVQEGRSEMVENALSGPIGPKPRQMIQIADPGEQVWAVAPPSANPRGQGYVETAAGANLGLIFDAPSPTRVPFEGFAFDGLDSDDPTRARGAF